MDAGHGLGESDIQTTQGIRCCNKLGHIKEHKAASPTKNMHEARWRPAQYLIRQQIKYNPDQKFLGITYEPLLTFGLHTSTVGSKMKQQAGALRCLASTDWGYEKSILWSTYIATGRLTVKYTATAWLPWVFISTMEKLKMSHRYAGRAITRQIKTTPVEAILAEADLQPLLPGPHKSPSQPCIGFFECLTQIKEGR